MDKLAHLAHLALGEVLVPRLLHQLGSEVRLLEVEVYSEVVQRVHHLARHNLRRLLALARLVPREGCLAVLQNQPLLVSLAQPRHLPLAEDCLVVVARGLEAARQVQLLVDLVRQAQLQARPSLARQALLLPSHSALALRNPQLQVHHSVKVLQERRLLVEGEGVFLVALRNNRLTQVSVKPSNLQPRQTHLVALAPQHSKPEVACSEVLQPNLPEVYSDQRQLLHHQAGCLVAHHSRVRAPTRLAPRALLQPVEACLVQNQQGGCLDLPRKPNQALEDFLGVGHSGVDNKLKANNNRVVDYLEVLNKNQVGCLVDRPSSKALRAFLGVRHHSRKVVCLVEVHNSNSNNHKTLFLVVVQFMAPLSSSLSAPVSATLELMARQVCLPI